MYAVRSSAKPGKCYNSVTRRSSSVTQLSFGLRTIRATLDADALGRPELKKTPAHEGVMGDVDKHRSITGDDISYLHQICMNHYRNHLIR